MKRASIILAALTLASCSAAPPITCDNDGLIVIPAGTAEAPRSDWEARNRALLIRRMDKVTGRAEWQTPASLEKADGCP
jgi:hypothetical protein